MRKIVVSVLLRESPQTNDRDRWYRHQRILDGNDVQALFRAMESSCTSSTICEDEARCFGHIECNGRPKGTEDEGSQ